jgi:hypothetical protein
MMSKTLAQLTSDELRRERDTLAMLYDDHCRAVWDEDDPQYTDADLQAWDWRIVEIDDLLISRERCPECGHAILGVVGGGDTPAWYECQQCLVRFPLADVIYDDSAVEEA